MTNTISLYTISNKYLSYLKQFDSRISSHDSKSGSIYVGAVLERADSGAAYFVPLTSYSSKKEGKMRNRQQIIVSILEKGNMNNKLGYMLFNNMIPVPRSELIKVDLTDQSIPKNRMMKKQQIYIRSVFGKVKHKAELVHRKQIEGNSYFLKWCCDFQLLENKCIEYMNAHGLSKQNEVHLEDPDIEI